MSKKENKVEKKISEFSDLLDSLQKTEDKKKLLWKEAYQNALDDRSNAGILFTDLLIQSQGNSANHIQFGQLMNKYLERMAKSNDQILKLAELIAKEEEKNETMTPDDIFDKIGS
tara:strand:+ start:2502 stop:2846 length:345 start_codon:yes stop_codon:yes gene_type:complete